MAKSMNKLYKLKAQWGVQDNFNAHNGSNTI